MNNPNTITQRVVIDGPAGIKFHFDVTVHLKDIARAQMDRAIRNKSRRSVVAGGAVCVEFVP